MKKTMLAPWGTRRFPTRLGTDPMLSWREFDRFFDGFPELRSFPFGSEMGDFRPRANVSESEGEIIITIELPGLDESDIDISMKRDVLTIKGEKKLEQKEDEGNYCRMERRYGSFSRTFRLPLEVVDAERINATFVNGVLTINLPKQEQEVEISRRINVQAG